MAMTQPLCTQDYADQYADSVKNNEDYWRQHGQCLDWIKPYTQVKNCSFDPGHVSIRWFEDGTLNASQNCLDRHLQDRKDKIAIIWEGDDAAEQRFVTYGELHEEVCKFANVLKNRGIQKGDRVIIYMPLVIEAVAAMLACARIGAIHSVVFGGFSAKALEDRIRDCEAKAIITANEGMRCGKHIPLKANVDAALNNDSCVETCFVLRRTSTEVSMQEGRDLWLDEALESADSHCPPTEMNAEDPLFILYTSGSTGKPKGVVHTTGGYLVYASHTHATVFDARPDDVYWCTADIGWITGHTYVTYGPLLNGSTVVLFEGNPTHPNPGRLWEIIDRYQVTTFYTAPTAIRSLMKEGDSWVHTSARTSLRLLGTVGEPINVEAWQWYHDVVGRGQCPIMDTWWQTETGGIMMSAQPGRVDTKPGSASKPFYGIQPVLMDSNGKILEGAASGNLCIADSWPGQARTIYKDHQRFEQTYFSAYPGYYFTSDGCRRDEDGFYWITGRVDDVINVSGHRLGTAEIEDALNSHENVVESAVVGFPHPIKGEGIYAYVILKNDAVASEDLKADLVRHVRTHIGPVATIDYIQWAAAGLPKTRSGKIMRRILRKVAAGETDNLGDISTLAEPHVVDHLISHSKHQTDAS